MCMLVLGVSVGLSGLGCLSGMDGLGVSKELMVKGVLMN